MEQVDIYMQCAKNPWFFIINFVTTIHPLRGKVPFKLFPFQVSVLYQLIKNPYNIILKPRQMGMSVLVAAYALWLAMFHPHKNIMIISLKLDTATALLRKIKSMYRSLPTFLKTPPEGGDYDNPGTVTRIGFDNGSQIMVSAATEDAGRSESLSLLIMDECAIQRYAGQIWTAAQQTLATGGKAILLSSAYGVGNFFHQTWVDAVANVNGFFPIKLNWEMHPERDKAWYAQQKKLMGSKRVAQEVDCDFLTSGYNVFDLADIRAIEDRLLDRAPIRSLYNDKFHQYHEFDPNDSYYIGADVAAGRDRDYSTFSIYNEQGKEFACYKNNIISPRDFGKLLMEWGEKANYAMLAPEVNAVGEGPLALMEEYHYPNIYYRVAKTMRKGDFYKSEDKKPGWYTTSKNRNEIINGMDDDLRDDSVEIWNPFFTQEAYTFIYNEANKPIALGKELRKSGGSSHDLQDDNEAYSDDSIIASCIGNEVRKNPGKYSGALPMA